MENLEELLERLSDRHHSALRWFAERTGTNQHWPEPLSDGTLLAMKPKGIYKPQWTEYALSVRQTLGGRYKDIPPIVRSDGTWSFSYFQENNLILWSAIKLIQIVLYLLVGEIRFPLG